VPPKNSSGLPIPPDQSQRIAALDPQRSVIVQAPAGSGKTDLLTRRFLRLLAEVDDPKQIVAITFTKAAAAEMRHRILAELEKAATPTCSDSSVDEWSMEALAVRALEHSQKLDWKLLDLSSQLRISTIDSFCRDLAIQQPIHSGIGNNLQINERPAELYRIAARGTLEKLGDPVYPELSDAIRDLLLWRDNGWKELEDLLIKMLGQRDRWMLDIVLSRKPDWDLLRELLERPMANAVRSALDNLEQLLTPDDRTEAHELAQFACAHGAGEKYGGLAELAEFPNGPHTDNASLEEARGAYLCLANLLLKNDGILRRKIDTRLGFPKEHLDEKLRMEDLLGRLAEVQGLEDSLAGWRKLPPARYTEDDWQIIRASFLLLRHAAAELKTVFAEAGTVDFIEVAQIAKQVLRGEDNLPSDAAQAVADDIRHLLVDEFQDTSRRQHEFITALIEAWPDPADRTIFVVGDPMQSIYFFRDAEAELFRRVKDLGFELSDGESFPLYSGSLSANFRTDPALVSDLNQSFARIFAVPDGSGIEFAHAEPARTPNPCSEKRLKLHVDFIPQTKGGSSSNPAAVRARQQVAAQRESVRKLQLDEIVTLIRSHLDRIEEARAAGQKYRVAVLGRARTALAPIALALREAGIPFRAVELESLRDRPEILDAVSLTRALFNPEDRVAWLGVLRAPWCGLSLAELHTIAGTDEGSRSNSPIPQLIVDRLHLLPAESRKSVERVLAVYTSTEHLRAKLPTASTGTLIQQIWRALGGDRCVDHANRANLDLFWKLLDKLPNGQQDLAGPALDAALEDLCAMPDPATSSECGVQLMTIHKSKGLEFEVVIVPDLQAQSGRGGVELLSWLERGLAEPSEDGELTEFLIAPVQYKGTDPGAAKRWVDRARRDRETQEMRRILYVASTRAREELHLFAQPAYKFEADASQTLLEPSDCLLATAWPALEGEIRSQFDGRSRSAQMPVSTPTELIIPSIAAGQGDLLFMPSPIKATIIRRLPPDSESAPGDKLRGLPVPAIIGLGEPANYVRHEGGLLSRSLGNAVHKLLEQLSRLRTTFDWDDSRIALEESRSRIINSIRASGIPAAQAEKIAARAFDSVIQVSHDPQGQWILSPHAEASSESGWAGMISGNLHQIRIDRLFRAGLSPLEESDLALWIIDYKTAHADDLDVASTVSAMRKTFAPQLETYATILRNLHGSAIPIRAGLYYPRMSFFDWWEI
jgi:ATP-dependent helicase/nuclease subunit A